MNMKTKMNCKTEHLFLIIFNTYSKIVTFSMVGRILNCDGPRVENRWAKRIERLELESGIMQHRLKTIICFITVSRCPTAMIKGAYTPKIVLYQRILQNHWFQWEWCTTKTTEH